MSEAFDMPKPLIGEPILYYWSGGTDCDPTIAHALKVGASSRSIAILLPNGVGRDGVRHISDPRLKESIELRNDCGAWDFCENHYSIKKLEKRVSDLEALLETKTKK